MNNNYLFLKMQTGGQLSPEQLQRAQQMGQLPQMGMGAGLNDIQKMNMQQAEHYGMFRRGGVPRNYAEGGEQEEIDQQYLSPYVKYNQRVSEFLENLKSTAMGALQDEMMGVNDEYAQEADQIEMEQAQYGQQVSQPTVNPQGMNAVNAWMGAAQNTKDMVQPLAQTAGLASGLKGYWGSQDDYEANPYNSAWNPTRLTVTDNTTGKKTVTRAKRNSIFSQPIPTATQPPANTNEEECTPGTNCFPDTYEYGGQYFAPGGENENGDESPYDANGQLKPGYRIASRPGAYGSMRSVIVNSSGAEVGETDQSRQTQAGVNSTKVEGDRNTASLFMAPAGIYKGLAGAAGTALRFAGDQMFDKPGTNLQLPQGSSTGVGPFTGNVGAPATASGTPTFGGVTPNFYSAGLQGGKSQMATGQAMDSYGDKARTDEAAYKAKQEEERVKAQQAQVEKNAIAMGWVKPDGTADVEGYRSIGPNGKQWEPKPGFNPNAALPKSVDKKEKQKKDKTAPGTGSSSAGTSSAGTPSTPPTGTEVVKNADGTESSLSPEEAAKRKADAAAQATQVVDPGKTPAATPAAAPGTTPTATTTTTPPKTGTGEIDYLASLADPTGQNAGGVYRTDRNGNPVPMAFYDPNMRLTGMSADYRNNVASWFRKNKKPGQMKSVSFDFGSSTPYTVPGVPAANNNLPPEGTQVVTNPDGTESSISPEEAARREQIAMGMPEGTSTITNPDGTQSSVAPDFYERNFPAPKIPTWDPSQFIPKYNAPSPPAIAPQAPQQPAAPQPMSPGAAWNPQDFLPTSLRTRKNGGDLHKFFPGGENPEGVGVLSNPVDPTPNTSFFETGLLPQPEQSNYMSPVLPGETVMEQNKSFTAKYDKNKKSNPFFAPAMLAGLDLVAGAAQNRDAKKKEGQLRGKLSYDQIYSANPETSGSRGDWTFNEGYMRPNDMVPTQFTGNGMQTAQWGGAYAEGDELYLDEDAIQAFLAAGGQLDYLD